MRGVISNGESENERIVLELLESVERDGGQSQRKLAAELGIALGLCNAYLKRCVTKGLVKMSAVPARRYAYFLTPQGFAEKSRLTVEYLSFSFGFFRQAKQDCRTVLKAARKRGFARVVLAGKSELTEIAVICALESDVEIVAVVDDGSNGGRFVGVPLVRRFDDLADKPDAVVITDLLSGHRIYKEAIGYLGGERVLVPELLRLRLRNSQEHDK